jgi:hypothetical protein
MWLSDISCNILKLWFHYLLAYFLREKNVCNTIIISTGGFETIEIEVLCLQKKNVILTNGML